MTALPTGTATASSGTSDGAARARGADIHIGHWHVVRCDIRGIYRDGRGSLDETASLAVADLNRGGPRRDSDGCGVGKRAWRENKDAGRSAVCSLGGVHFRSQVNNLCVARSVSWEPDTDFCRVATFEMINILKLNMEQGEHSLLVGIVAIDGVARTP